MIGRLVNRVHRWVQGLSRGWLVAGTSVFGLVLVLASVGMFRVYDYVQHDNNFCVSCHLMADPFARFERSSHRELGCKACHRPNIWQRSKMGLTQILEMPDSITQHAEVPREICAECHVDGNPEEWKLIANSVGHRVHLESDDPALKNLQCVDCHGSGIHDFAASTKSCAQSGCHENTGLRLGGMSGLTVHCATCHDFNKPVERSVRGDRLTEQLVPRGNECMSCHAMRVQLGGSLPVDDAHGSVCGSCHNPHAQSTPAEAVKSCATGECHQRVDTVSSMHRQLATGVLQKCTTCHRAHSWDANAEACASCHTPESLDAASKPLHLIESTAKQQSLVDVALLPMRLSIRVLAQLALAGEPFKHKLHRRIACTSCHQSEDGHGVLRIRTATDCSGCHHAAANLRRCAACHPPRELTRAFQRRAELTLSTGTTRTRTLDFKHATHVKVECTSCHTTAANLRAVPSCASCHTDHHTEARDCTACHAAAATVPQHKRDVHTTCSGTGCHKSAVTEAFRYQRNVCLACHTEQKNHEPDGDCAACHLIARTRTPHSSTTRTP